MKIIGAGFGRTGTDSLKEALELLLGGRCYHMREVFANAGHLERWEAFGASGRRNMDWPALFADFDACVDWPAANYYREIKQAFPGAKVLLSVRDPESWFDSFQVLVRLTAVIGAFSFVPRFARFRRMTQTVVMHIFEDRRDRKHCIEVFQRHVEEVKTSVPPDELLVFDVREGWEPLCRFLGVPVPTEPFPHKNRRGDIQREARRMIALELLKTYALPATAAVIAIAGIAWWAL